MPYYSYIPDELREWRSKTKKDYKKKMKTFKIDKVFFYIVELYDNKERFIKVGITSNLKTRFKDITYKYNTLKLIHLPVDTAWELESKALNILYRNKLHYAPKKLKGGVTECFTLVAITYFDEILVDIVNKSIDIQGIKQNINTNVITKSNKVKSKAVDVTIDPKLFRFITDAKPETKDLVLYMLEHSLNYIDCFAIYVPDVLKETSIKDKAQYDRILQSILKEGVLYLIPDKTNLFKFNPKYIKLKNK